MNWLIGYLVVAIVFAIIASVAADAFGTNAGAAALLTALFWPVVTVGAAQVVLWISAVKICRGAPASIPVPTPLRLRLT